MAKVFIDTNLLIYAYDAREGAKHAHALSIVRSLREARVGYVSTQVLGEFHFAATGRRHGFMTLDQAQGQLRNIVAAFPVLEITEAMVFHAARVARLYRFSYWDAQLCVVALRNDIPFMLTEDLQPGQRVEGRLQFLSPFDPAFDLDALLALP